VRSTGYSNHGIMQIIYDPKVPETFFVMGYTPDNPDDAERFTVAAMTDKQPSLPATILGFLATTLGCSGLLYFIWRRLARAF